MHKVIGVWAQVAFIMGVGYFLLGGWGVSLIALLGVLVWLVTEQTCSIAEVQALLAKAEANPLARFEKVRDEEEEKRLARQKRLYHLDTDIRHAQELMRLEERAQELRAEYARRRAPYYHDVETELQDIFDQIEGLKRGRPG